MFHHTFIKRCRLLGCLAIKKTLLWHVVPTREPSTVFIMMGQAQSEHLNLSHIGFTQTHWYSLISVLQSWSWQLWSLCTRTDFHCPDGPNESCIQIRSTEQLPSRKCPIHKCFYKDDILRLSAQEHNNLWLFLPRALRSGKIIEICWTVTQQFYIWEKNKMKLSPTHSLISRWCASLYSMNLSFPFIITTLTALFKIEWEVSQ